MAIGHLQSGRTQVCWRATREREAMRRSHDTEGKVCLPLLETSDGDDGKRVQSNAVS